MKIFEVFDSSSQKEYSQIDVLAYAKITSAIGVGPHYRYGLYYEEERFILDVIMQEYVSRDHSLQVRSDHLALTRESMLDDLVDVGLLDASFIPSDAIASGDTFTRVSTFHNQELVFRPPIRPWWLGIAIWSLAMVFGILFLVSLSFARTWPARLRMDRALKHGAQGICPTCTYELKGLKSDTCPECGEPIPPPRKSGRSTHPN